MKLEGCEIAHRSRGSCTRRDISLSELRWRKTHLRAQSLHELKSQGQLHLVLAGRLSVSVEGLAGSSPARPPTPAAALGAVLQSPVASGPTKLDCMVRVPRNICQN